jgi:hypothetical protein
VPSTRELLSLGMEEAMLLRRDREGEGDSARGTNEPFEKDISKRLMICRYTNTTTVLWGDCLIEHGIPIITTCSTRWRVWL